MESNGEAPSIISQALWRLGHLQGMLLLMDLRDRQLLPERSETYSWSTEERFVKIHNVVISFLFENCHSPQCDETTMIAAPPICSRSSARTTSSTVGCRLPKHGDNFTCSSKGLTPSQPEGDPPSPQRVKQQHNRYLPRRRPLDRWRTPSIALLPQREHQLPAHHVSPPAELPLAMPLRDDPPQCPCATGN